MYEEKKKKGQISPIQTNNSDVRVQMKPHSGKFSGESFQDVRVSNVIQRTRYMYDWDEPGWSEMVEPFSPEPSPEATAILLENHTEGDYVAVDTASDSYLKQLLNKLWISVPGCIDNYKSPNEEIKPPHKFGQDEDIQRVLRWIATFFATVAKITGELKCYYVKSSEKIVMSTDDPKEMEQVVRVAQQISFPKHGNDRQARQARHINHMKKLFMAIKNLKKEIVELPSLNFSFHAGTENYHAEQKILDFLKNPEVFNLEQLVYNGELKVDEDGSLRLNPALLGGVTDSCMTCVKEVFTKVDSEKYPSGYVDLTTEAYKNMDSSTIVRLIEAVEKLEKTYVTMMKDGTVTDKFGVESDDEEDSDDLYERIAGKMFFGDNVIQCTRYEYNWNDDSWSAITETPSPPPSDIMTEKILESYREGAEIYMDTASTEYLDLCLKNLWNAYGANQSLKYFSPKTTVPITGWAGYSSKLEAMHREADNQEGIHMSREYTPEEDIHRIMRWVATFYAATYKVESEVQCYLIKSHGKILIAANTESDINKMNGVFKDQPVPQGLNNRQKRHIKHMEESSKVYREWKKSGRTPIEYSRACVTVLGKPNWHAEQRILHEILTSGVYDIGQMIAAGELKEEDDSLKLNPNLLGGIRRTCKACEKQVFTNEDAQIHFSGPLWPTHCALDNMDSVSLVRLIQAVEECEATYVTATRENTIVDDGSPSPGDEGEPAREYKIVDDCDTSSEDEGEPAYERIVGEMFF